MCVCGGVILGTVGDTQYHGGDIMMHMGDIMSTMGMFGTVGDDIPHGTQDNTLWYS